jgi:hypoxanthine phosphoribosyltransferase
MLNNLNQKPPVLSSANNLKFEIPTWNQIYSFLLNLAGAVQKSGFEPEVIVGVSRGGCIPARIMSDLLGNLKLANVKAEFYVGVAETRNEPVITQPVSFPVVNKRVLVVDDVADTGKSLNLIKSHLKEQGAVEIKIAAMYSKPWSSVVPDYCENETCLWIVFPWERKETVRKIIEKFRGEGKTIEDAKEKLINSGLGRKLVERFTKELFGEKP